MRIPSPLFPISRNSYLKNMIYWIGMCFALGFVAILLSVQLRRRRLRLTGSAQQPHLVRGSVGAWTPDLWIIWNSRVWACSVPRYQLHHAGPHRKYSICFFHVWLRLYLQRWLHWIQDRLLTSIYFRIYIFLLYIQTLVLRFNEFEFANIKNQQEQQNRIKRRPAF